MIAPMTEARDEDPLGYKARLAAIGLEQKDACAALGWSSSSMSRFLSGGTRPPEAKRKRFLGWLAAEEAGRGVTPPSQGGGADIVSLPPRTGAQNARLYVPVFGLAAAGSAVALNHAHVVDQVPIEELLGGRAVMQNRFLLEVIGSSMEPRYRPGERVLCVRNRHPRSHEDAVFEMHDGSAELKTYVRRADGVIWYDQANPSAGDDAARYFKEADVKAIHAVIGRF